MPRPRQFDHATHPAVPAAIAVAIRPALKPTRSSPLQAMSTSAEGIQALGIDLMTIAVGIAAEFANAFGNSPGVLGCALTYLDWPGSGVAGDGTHLSLNE